MQSLPCENDKKTELGSRQMDCPIYPVVLQLRGHFKNEALEIIIGQDHTGISLLLKEDQHCLFTSLNLDTESLKKICRNCFAVSLMNEKNLASA